MSVKKNNNLGGIGTSKHPIIRAIKKNKTAEPLVNKLIKEKGSGRTRSFGQQTTPVSETLARTVSDETTMNIQDNNNIFQLLPDTELAKQILVSSILSPKDMINVELGYKNNTKKIDGEVTGQMLEVVKTFFEQNYNIKKLLPEILGDVLFHKGSYPMLILPENSIDKVINADKQVGLESILKDSELFVDSKFENPKRSIGLLGSRVKSTEMAGSWSLESLNTTQDNLTLDDLKINYGNDKKGKVFNNFLKGDVIVADNPDLLSLPTIIEIMRKRTVRDNLGYRVSLERKKDNISNSEIYNSVFRDTNYQTNNYISIKRGDCSKNSHHPLTMKLPPEAIIPVHVPSNPSQHVGYFVLLDHYGNPLNRVKESNYYRDLSNNISNSEITSQLLETGKRAAEGSNSTYMREHELSEVVRTYSEVIERDLLERLKNGVYGGNIEISNTPDVYRVMLSRSLAQLKTQILYVPAELVNYIAFDYNQYGVGKSLLEDSKVLASMRSMLMFSNTMAMIKNSVGKTALKIELEPEDPDPEGTVSYMIQQYSKNRQSSYPLGASNPLDIIDFLQNAGVDVQVSGNPAYPETKLEVEDYSTNKTEIDSTLEDDIKKKYFMALGLSPETIDMTSDVEFATSIVSSNLLLAKRVIIYQDKLLGHLKDFITKYCLNSGEIRQNLIDIASSSGVKRKLLEDFKKATPEEIVDEFLNSLEITLPRPDSTKIENQREAYDKYVDFLEMAIDAYLEEEMFELEGFEDYDRAMRGIRSAVMNHYKREWLRTNNVLPELMDMVLTDKDNKPLFDLKEIHGNHTEAIGKSVNKLITKMRKDEARRKRRMEKEEETINRLLEGVEEEEETKPDPEPEPLTNDEDDEEENPEEDLIDDEEENPEEDLIDDEEENPEEEPKDDVTT